MSQTCASNAEEELDLNLDLDLNRSWQGERRRVRSISSRRTRGSLPWPGCAPTARFLLCGRYKEDMII